MRPDAVFDGLRAIVGTENVLWRKADLQTYAYDAWVERSLPEAVVFVESTEEVAAVVRYAARAGMPFLPRGSATNLTGGTVPVRGGLVIETARMRRVVEIDTAGERIVVECGLRNLEVSAVLDPLGYYFAPDPASQKVSSIGGNIAENAGGPHCFKYGVTSDHVLGAEVVLPDGEVVWLGGGTLDPPGIDLLGGFVGSEGTFGICTRAELRIMRKPEARTTLLAIYDTVDDAARTVSSLVAAGMVPAALEMMDGLVVEAIEASEGSGLPRGAGAVLLIELDGLRDGMDDMAADVCSMCGHDNAREVRVAATEDEREALWKGRRGALGAIARLAPNYLLVDGTVPRVRLPDALRRVRDVGERHDLRIPVVAHAGDGNLHPVVLFDSRRGAERQRAVQACSEILAACVELGGTISGEHGVGLEKIEAMTSLFSANDLRAQRWLKEVFDPLGLCNPGKVLPPPEEVAAAAIPAGTGEVVAEPDPPPAFAAAGDHPQTSVAGVEPAARVRPATVRELAETVAWASGRDMAMAAVGSGTRLGIGNPPSRLDLMLDMSALDAVVDYDADDLVMTAEAGATIGQLQSLVREDSLVLPLDPPSSERATLGGVVACADHGPRRRLYGGLRGLVLGLKVVLPDGAVASFGGRTLKNVAGYDVGTLFIGSLGTLGVIAEVSLRLLPSPACEELVLVALPGLEMSRRLAVGLLRSTLVPSAMELLSPTCGVLLGLDRYAPAPGGRYLMLIALEGHPAAVDRQARDILSMCDELSAEVEGETEGARARRASEAGLAPAEGWRTFSRLREEALGAEDGVGVRCAVPLGLVWDVAAAVEGRSAAGAVAASWAMSFGTGQVEVYVSGAVEEVRAFVEGVRTDTEQQGGTATVLDGWPVLGDGFDAWGNSPELRLIRALKQKFDPRGVMNPGRQVGRL